MNRYPVVALVVELILVIYCLLPSVKWRRFILLQEMFYLSDHQASCLPRIRECAYRILRDFNKIKRAYRDDE